MRFIYAIFLVFVFPFSLMAQDAPNGTYFFLGGSFPIVTVRDQAHSPLKYNGIAASLRLGYEAIKNSYVSRFTVSTTFGAIRPKMKPRKEKHLSTADLGLLQINYAYYHNIGGKTQGDWYRYLGGAITFTFDSRNYNLPSNNLLGYQANASLNFGGTLIKALNNKWEFNYEAFTPILSYALRPNYVGMIPIRDGEFNPKYVFSNGKFVTFNKLFRFYNRFAFDQHIKDYRMRRLSYTWDFHANYVSEKPLHAILGGVGYDALFKL